MIKFHVYDPKDANKVANLRKKIDEALNKQFAKKVRKMFGDLVRVSPQWSGDFASNWKLSLTPTATYSASAEKGNTPRGSERVRVDMHSLYKPIYTANFVKINYKQPVYFVNASPVAFVGNKAIGNSQPYAGAHYPRVTKVRPENLVNGTVALASYIKSKYSQAGAFS